MAVRSFNGSSDFLTLSPGATTGLTGNVTLALLIKLLGTNQAGFMVNANNASGVTFAQNLGLWVEATPGSKTQFDNNLVGANSSNTTLAATDGWVVIAAVKATGTVVPRISKMTLAGVATHNDCGATAGDNAALQSTSLWEFGRDESSNHLSYELALAAVWDVVLSDTEVVNLVTNLRSSDWLTASAAKPRALWQFNQAAVGTSVLDLMQGGANQAGISGTSVVTNDDPAGWAFDLPTVAPVDVVHKKAMRAKA